MACVYTPRGLKIRLNVQDAFVYLSRVRDRYTAFQGLRIVEDIVNAPAFFSWIISIAMLLADVKPFTVLLSMAGIRIALILVQRKFIRLTECVIAPLWPLVRPFSYLSGRGLFLLMLLVVVFLKYGIAWTGMYLGMCILVYFLDITIGSAEIAFAEALFYMADKCGVVMSLKIEDSERKGVDWAICYGKLMEEYPVMTNRFVYELDFQGKLLEAVACSKSSVQAEDSEDVVLPESRFQKAQFNADDHNVSVRICNYILAAERTLLDGESNYIGDSVLLPLRSQAGRLAIKGSVLDVLEFTYSRIFGAAALNRFVEDLEFTAEHILGNQAIEFKRMVGAKFAEFDYDQQIEISDSYLVPRCMSCETCIALALFNDDLDEAAFARFRYRFEEVVQKTYADMYDILNDAGYISESPSHSQSDGQNLHSCAKKHGPVRISLEDAIVQDAANRKKCRNG